MRKLLLSLAIILLAGTSGRAASRRSARRGLHPRRRPSRPTARCGWSAATTDRIVVMRSNDLGRMLLRAGRRHARSDGHRLGNPMRARTSPSPHGQPDRDLRDLPGPALQTAVRSFARSTDNGASLQPSAADDGRHHQPALRERGDRSRRPGVRRLARPSATLRRPVPPTGLIPARRWPMPGRTTVPLSARRASP